MKRRKFLKNASVAGGATAVAASTFPAPAISQGRIRWNAVSAFGKAGLLGQALEEFTRFVNTASEGKLTIKAYHAGELASSPAWYALIVSLPSDAVLTNLVNSSSA